MFLILYLSVVRFIISLQYRCCVSTIGPTRFAHRGRAAVCFGFLHSRELTETWLWTRALWFHAAGKTGTTYDWNDYIQRHLQKSAAHSADSSWSDHLFYVYDSTRIWSRCWWLMIVPRPSFCLSWPNITASHKVFLRYSLLYTNKLTVLNVWTVGSPLRRVQTKTSRCNMQWTLQQSEQSHCSQILPVPWQIMVAELISHSDQSADNIILWHNRVVTTLTWNALLNGIRKRNAKASSAVICGHKELSCLVPFCFTAHSNTPITVASVCTVLLHMDAQSCTFLVFVLDWTLHTLWHY